MELNVEVRMCGGEKMMFDTKIDNLLDRLCEIDPNLTKILALYFVVEYHPKFSHISPPDMWWKVYNLDQTRGSYSFGKYMRLRAEFFIWKEKLLPFKKRKLLECF